MAVRVEYNDSVITVGINEKGLVDISGMSYDTKWSEVVNYLQEKAKEIQDELYKIIYDDGT